MKNIYIILFTILIIVSACRKDKHLIEDGPTTGITEITEQSDLNGLVVDIDGNTIEGAKIILDNTILFTDKNGMYFFTNADINSNGTLIKIEKQGYIPQFRFVFNEPGKLSTFNFVIIPEVEITKFSSNIGGTFTIQEKSKVKFPPNSIVHQDGSPYQGEVTLNGHWYDPFDDKTLSAMPGDLRGSDKNGNRVQLATQGMFSLNIYDNQGNELALGNSVELSFYVGNQGIDVDGKGEMPLWYFDEETGEWIEEGNSILDGEYFVGEVSHFSFWNCDYPYPLTFIKGTLIDNEGLAIQNADIKIVEQNFLSCGTGSTNEEGYFEAYVPAQVDLTISLIGCDNGIDIGPFNEESNDLGAININIEVSTITGILLDCNGQEVKDGYIVLNNELTSKLISSDQNGEFNVQLADCSEKEWTFTAYDPSNLIYSETIIIDPTNKFIDLKEVNFCNNLDFYFAVEHNDDFDIFISPTSNELQVLLLDNNCLVISNNFDDPLGITYTLVYPLDESLPRNVFEQITHTTNGTQFFSGEHGFSIDFTQFGYELGDVIAGSFEMDNTKLEFRLKINQKEESAAIILNSWNDENFNGIQDNNEGYGDLSEIFIQEVGNDSTLYESYYKIPIFLTSAYPLPSGQAYAQFNGLKGNTEYTLFYSINPLGPDYVSPANQGSDDTIDSDFIQVPFNPQNYQTDSFYLSKGQIEASYDIGTY